MSKKSIDKVAAKPIEKVVANGGDQERLVRLRDLFPELMSDGQVNAERLRQLLEADGAEVATPEEHYGLTWPGKQQARRLASQPPPATLRPVSGDGVDETTTQNFVIVGDNLEVLLALQKSYANAVKLIYIDPPYNTGNDFIYKDRFEVDEDTYLLETRQADLEGRIVSNPQSSGRFHSNWLNFMYPRLRVARNLLSLDGLIVIHIDEHEQETLVLICKEIFGEENYLGTIVWDKGNPKGDSKGLGYQHESIVLFAKEFDSLPELKRPKPNAERILSAARSALANNPNIEKARVAFATWIRGAEGLSGGEAAYNRLDTSGRVFQSVSMAWPNKKIAPPEYFRPLTHPVTGKTCPVPERGWRNPPDTMARLLAEDQIEFGIDETTQPRRRYYLDENIDENVPSVLKFAGSDDAVLKRLGIPYEHPKPTEFATQLVSWFSRGDDLVMDFFAGSGTAGHAVWLANHRRGEGRKFILVQIDAPPEQGGASSTSDFNTLDEITCQRLRRASEELKADSAGGDLGFRVLRVDSPALVRARTMPAGGLDATATQGSLVLEAKPVTRRPAELFIEVLLLLGYPLDAHGAQVPQSSANTLWRFEHPRVPTPLLLCLDSQIDEDLVEALRAHPKHTFVCLDEALTDVVKARFFDALKTVDSSFKVL